MHWLKLYYFMKMMVEEKNLKKVPFRHKRGHFYKGSGFVYMHETTNRVCIINVYFHNSL